MLPYQKQFAGLLILSTVAFASLSEIKPAYSFSFDDVLGTVTIDEGDEEGTSVKVFFYDSMQTLAYEAVLALTEDYQGAGSSATFALSVTNASVQQASWGKLQFDVKDGNGNLVADENIFFDDPWYALGSIAIGETLDLGTLAYNSPTDSLVFSDFSLKYNSNGSYYANNYSHGEVPTPALLPGLIGMGVAALRKKRQQTQDKASASVN